MSILWAPAASVRTRISAVAPPEPLPIQVTEAHERVFASEARYRLVIDGAAVR